MSRDEQPFWIKETLRDKEMLHIFALYFFPSFVPDPNIPQAHFDLIDEITSPVDGAVIFPRGFAKSTWIKIDTLHDIVYGLEPVILYVGATVGDAGHHFESMKGQLEDNDLLRTVYGDLVPPESRVGRKWTARHFETINGVNVVARGRSRGRGVNIRNRRPTKIIIDDAEDDKLVRKEEQRAKFHDWLYSVIFPSIDKLRGRIKMVGTVLHEFAEVVLFYEKHGGVFKRAIENGESIWPAYFPKEYLESLRDKIGTRAFNREYMNNAKSEDEAGIKRAWIEKGYFTELPTANGFEGVVYLDPQAGESGMADEFAITVLYAERRSVHRYVVEQIAGRVSQLDQARMVVRTWLKHRKTINRGVGIEKVLNQTSVWQILQDWKARKINFNTEGMKAEHPDYVDESDRNIPIVAWSPKGKDKKARLEMFEPDFERGEIHIRREMETLRDQIMYMGTGNIDHDDRADSLIGALEMAGRTSISTNTDIASQGKKGYNQTIMGDIRNKVF